MCGVYICAYVQCLPVVCDYGGVLLWSVLWGVCMWGGAVVGVCVHMCGCGYRCVVVGGVYTRVWGL